MSGHRTGSTWVSQVVKPLSKEKLEQFTADAENRGVLYFSRIPPFLTKLTEILTVEDSEVVTLNANTPSFTICDPQRFAKEV